jgi:ABC-type nitrate/sulfonate/bicarbonate transport system ATPase subunit
VKDSVIFASGLSKRFNGNEVLSGFDLTVSSGTVSGIIGPSGCGKTTILRLLAGLERPNHGHITTSREGIRIAYVFQEPRLIPWQTALENVAFVLSGEVADRNERITRAREALESVEMHDALQLYPDQLSGGMERRVALARALAFNADVFLMDEPFAGLDFPLRMQMIDLFNSLLSQHPRSVVFVSHDTREITHLCDRVYVMNGRPCRVQETIELKPKGERMLHHGYMHKMEERMLEAMADAGVEKRRELSDR